MLPVKTLFSEITRRSIFTSAICDAARKGTREKARKKKVKVEVKKVGFIPHNQRSKKINLQRFDKHSNDSWKQIPKDNVYVMKYYQRPLYSVAEAIECHRETHHPSIYNVPNAHLEVNIHLNMQAEKSTRFVDNFQRIAMIEHKFDHGEDRKIMVFTKGQKEIAEARAAGAALVGGIELVKDITDGGLLLTDYQFVIAHPNILAELVALRGLMKRKFPNPKNETLGTNLADMITKFSNGISYKAVKDEHQQNFALIATNIGTLDMETKCLEENLNALLQDIDSVRPKRDGKFITQVFLKSAPSSELLKINPFLYVPELFSKSSSTQSTVRSEDETNDTNDSQQLAAVN